MWIDYGRVGDPAVRPKATRAELRLISLMTDQILVADIVA